jgi:hypothetical protein
MMKLSKRRILIEVVGLVLLTIGGGVGAIVCFARADIGLSVLLLVSCCAFAFGASRMLAVYRLLGVSCSLELATLVARAEDGSEKTIELQSVTSIRRRGLLGETYDKPIGGFAITSVKSPSQEIRFLSALNLDVDQRLAQSLRLPGQ